MGKFRRLFAFLLPLLLLTVITGQSHAALLDFGPIVPEVVGSIPPNIRAGFPAWFRDANRVPLSLCLEEVPGCLFAAVDRPDLTQPLAFPNIPDELFYYSATATIGQQLLFAGVEMNFFDNGDGTYEQVGFSRVRIRIDANVAGKYTITTPWKQYFFNVDQATIDANAGRRVINATEDIGLGPDGVFTGVLGGTIGPYVYSQGAPFGTAPNLFIGTGAALPVLGSTFTDPVTGQPANIFRVEGPPGFTTVSTNQFAITGKLYLDPIPTPLTVDKAIYSRNAAATEKQVSVFATTQAMSNQVNSAALPFPARFALTNIPSALQITGTDIPAQNLTTNDPANGKFFATSGILPDTGNLPATVTVTNVNDIPATIVDVPLVDEVVITTASYNPVNNTLSIAASSSDKVANPALQAFMPGMTDPLGTLSNGKLSVTLPVIDNSGPQPRTFIIPTSTITVTSAEGGTANVPVTTFVLQLPPPVTAADAATTITGSAVEINVLANDTIAVPGVIDAATVAIVTAPTNGAAVANPSGTVTYTPNALFSGTDTFTYRVNDALGQFSNTSIVTVTVHAPPVAVNDTASVEVNTLVSINVIANDSAFSSSLNSTTVNIVSPATCGTTNVLTTGIVEFTAPATVPAGPGTCSFDYVVSDTFVPSATSNVATVTVTITPAITIPPAAAATLTTTLTSPQNPGATVIFVGQGQGGSGTYQYQFWFNDGVAWSLVQDYSSSEIWSWDTTGLTPGTYAVQVNVRSAGSTFLPYEASTSLNYVLTAPNPPASAASSAILLSSLTSPQLPGPTVTFVGSAQGGSGAYEYQYWLNNGSTWNMVQDYSATNMWDWNTTGLAAGTYAVQINVRNAGSSALPYEAAKNVAFVLSATPPPAATGAELTALPASPMPGGTTSVTFTGTGFGGSGSYEYQFWFNDGTTWILLQDYSTANAAAWDPTTVPDGTYQFQVNVRSAGSTVRPYEAAQVITYVK